MQNFSGWQKLLLRALSYIVVAAATATMTLFLYGSDAGKLGQLQYLLEKRFVGEVDSAALEDAAAQAMVNALGDRWSYYIPAADYTAYQEQKKNAYVGIGVTISVREDAQGFDILKVEQGGSAWEAGILPGDILVEVEGQQVYPLGIDGTTDLIRGEEGTTVAVAVLRDGQHLNFTLPRKTVRVAVATGQMLQGNIGLVSIRNFNEHCADEAKEAIEKLLEQGAQTLIFDVRNNPGGYVSEMTALLDYLLPEGEIFRSVDYAGREEVKYSDAKCVEIPMAVLVNSQSYSAAEFFAAALEEYDWAVAAGTPTCGKGYFQATYRLRDGSAVGLSIGKYFTPRGVSLAEAGGLVPEILLEVDEQTEALIYTGVLGWEEDPQLQAAIKAMEKEK